MNRFAMTHLHSVLTRRLLLTGACSLALTLAACQNSTTADLPPIEGTDVTGAAIGGDFTLIDKNRKTVNWQDFRGKWAIFYFGYTFCPDACPIDMQQLIEGYNLFQKAHAEAAAKVQTVFITIDPARDTPEAVGEWTGAFSPSLLGLTGSQAQVDKAAKAFAVLYSKGEETAGGYLMNHSRFAYLIDPEGKPVALLPVDKGAKAVASDLAKLVS